MLKYGSEQCLLDATYRTTQYAVPLYFVAVQTNVGFCVVASFFLEQDTTEYVQEALEIIKKWNSGWNPKYFLTDFDMREIKALKQVFHGKDTVTRSQYNAVIMIKL